jgi:hypothetical protein
MTDDIIDQLSYYVANEMRMPAGLIVTVINEIERLQVIVDEAKPKHKGFPDDDIVVVLRTMVQYTNYVAGGVCWRAADEIERLRNALEDERELRLNAETSKPTMWRS